MKFFVLTQSFQLRLLSVKPKFIQTPFYRTGKEENHCDYCEEKWILVFIPKFSTTNFKQMNNISIAINTAANLVNKPSTKQIPVTNSNPLPMYNIVSGAGKDLITSQSRYGNIVLRSNISEP